MKGGLGVLFVDWRAELASKEKARQKKNVACMTDRIGFVSGGARSALMNLPLLHLEMK